MRTLGYTIALATIWVLLWGSASPANVLSGLLLGWLLVHAVPGLRRRGGGFAFRPVAIARFGGHLLRTVVTSNIRLIREVLSPNVRTAIVGVPLPGCSDEVLTLISNLLALSPGTMPLELTHDPIVLYVHVLHLGDVEQVRREILRLDRPHGAGVRVAGRSRRSGRVHATDRRDPVIEVAYVALALATALFGFRLLRGPSLADRVTGIDGMLVTGMSLIIVRAMDTGQGAFLPTAVVLALVSFISTSVVARYIEGRGE